MLWLLRFHTIMTFAYKRYQDSNEMAGRTVSFGPNLKIHSILMIITEVLFFPLINSIYEFAYI